MNRMPGAHRKERPSSTPKEKNTARRNPDVSPYLHHFGDPVDGKPGVGPRPVSVGGGGRAMKSRATVAVVARGSAAGVRTAVRHVARRRRGRGRRAPRRVGRPAIRVSASHPCRRMSRDHGAL